MSIMDGSWFSVDSRTMAQDAAGPSTPTEKRSAFRQFAAPAQGSLFEYRAARAACFDLRRLCAWHERWRKALRFSALLTVYDIRVCNALQEFHHLGIIKWSHEAWTEYQRFVVAVRATAPQDLSLRDCDRWLWGRDKEATLLKELTDQY
jgi:hypothetical protein